MPNRVTDALGTIAEQLSGKWRVIFLVAAAGSFAFGATGTMKSVAQVPGRLDRHITQTDSTLVELQRMRKAHETELCLQIAALRHSDWTVCLVPHVD